MEKVNNYSNIKINKKKSFKTIPLTTIYDDKIFENEFNDNIIPYITRQKAFREKSIDLNISLNDKNISLNDKY